MTNDWMISSIFTSLTVAAYLRRVKVAPPLPPKPKLRRILRPKPNTIWQPGHAHCPPQSAILDSLKRSLNIVRTLTFRSPEDSRLRFATQSYSTHHYRGSGSVPCCSASSPDVAIRLSLSRFPFPARGRRSLFPADCFRGVSPILGCQTHPDLPIFARALSST